MKPVIKKEYYNNGNIMFEEYTLNGKKHRENEPARIWYYDNGNKESEYYYKNGLR